MTSIHSYIYSMEESARYATLADEMMSGSDAIVLSGHCGLKVSNKALHVKRGPLLGVEREDIIYYRGTVPIRTIIMLSRSGNISLDALYWCKEQDISVMMLDGNGDLSFSLSPEGESNAKLRRLQYQAEDVGKAGYIARELIRLKTLGQIEVLKTISEYSYKRVFKEYRKRRGAWDKPAWELLESGLVELSRLKDIGAMLMCEARLAVIYWDNFVGIPLNWRDSDAKVIAPHWKVITERPSSLSGASARRAICPFHAALNYVYGVAEHLLLCSIRASGLDPACGFLHSDKLHRDSLIYDLIEPHRAEIDNKVLDFFMQTTLRLGDVILLPSGQIMLNKELCRYLILSCLPDGKRLRDRVAWIIEQLVN